MQKGFVNFAFALFAALLLAGAMFATGQANQSEAYAQNQPPVITGLGGPSSLEVGQAGIWTIIANDPDGEYLFYSINWGDSLGQSQSGQREAGSTATFQHTYSQAGAYTITFTVYDSNGASTQATITVSVAGNAAQPDLAVTALSISTDSNGVTKFTPTVKNVGTTTSAGYSLSYKLDGSGVAVQTVNSGLVPGATHYNVLQRGEIPAGSHKMVVTITPQGNDASSANNVIAKVFEIQAQGNQPPVVTDLGGPTSLSVGQAGTWTIRAYDPDGTYLLYSVDWGAGEANPAIARQATGSTATFQHTYSHAGTYTITFTVTDSAGASTQATVTVNVGGISANQPPVITGISGPEAVIAGSTQTNNWEISAYDPEGTQLVYSVNWGDGNNMGNTYSSATVYAHAYLEPGIYTITFTAKDASGAKAQATKIVKVVEFTTSNKPPVITDVDGPTSIAPGQAGTWKVTAYDPDGTYLFYSVNWGENAEQAIAQQRETGSTATFQHTYSHAGTYTITFTVTDANGASVHSTYVVEVRSGIVAGSDVTASVGAIPTELYQYDKVHVVGKVTRGTIATNDEKIAYVVVLSFDNGNNIEKDYPSTTASRSSVAASVGASQAGQVRVEQIELAPGESKEVSAYFTAEKLGTNFAKIMVYQKISSCETATNAAGSNQNSACKASYKLVASDSAKVYVKKDDIPDPPSEKIVLKIERGWNMVSVPTGYDIQLSDIQAKCDITSAWYYNPILGQYSAATTFGKGIAGFWMKASSACEYELDEPYVSSWSSPLKAGWNLIGAPANGATLSSVSGDCKVTSGLWNYSPSLGQYTYSSKLEPGKGYWIKVDSACTLSDIGDMPPPVPSS